MNLTKNFSLDEFTSSQTATRKGFNEQSVPPDDVKDNLRVLCQELLQPLRDLLPRGIIKISSGYRCKRLNDAVGGKPNSQHVTGMAADTQYFEGGIMKNLKIIEAVKKNNLQFDQMINEYGGQWIHLSYNKSGNRKQELSIS